MTGKIKRCIIYITAVYTAAALFCIPALAARDPVFRLDTESLNLTKGVSASIVISVTNAQGAEVMNIEGIENFDVMSKSQSSVTNIIGGEIEYREDLYYTIMPKQTGQFTLKAYIKYDGQIYETNALQVIAGEAGENEKNGSVQDLFIVTNLSHSEAYLGEKIILTYELYSRYSIDNYGFPGTFAIDGVVARDILDNQLKSEYVYLDGERYAMYEAKRMIIDPIKAGVYTIPSCNFQVNVVNERSGGFGNFGFGSFLHSTTPVYLQTEKKELTVKPLPASGKPDDFSGIVGELQTECRYSRGELDYGDSLSLYFNLSGNCNLDSQKTGIIGKIAGFSVYETQKNTVESAENNKYYVQKDFEAVLVPEKNGVLEIPPIFISYFNPVTEKYEKAEIPGITVNVLGDIPVPGPGGGQAAANETLIIDQVNYAESKNGFFIFQIKKETVYKISAGLAAALVFSAALIKYTAKRKKQNPALKSLYRKLNGAKDINEIYSLFCSMVKYRYNLSLKASSKNIVQSRIQNESTASMLTEIMDYMESESAKEYTGKTGRNYLKDLKDKIKVIYRLF